MFPNDARSGSFRLLILSLIFTACTTDQLPEPVAGECDDVMPTYTEDIRPIIERSCAYSSCHLGAAPGLYDGYAGLLPVLESGEFASRVIDMRSDPSVGMPPNDAPDGRPIDLMEAEIDLISCWLEAGFPE